MNPTASPDSPASAASVVLSGSDLPALTAAALGFRKPDSDFVTFRRVILTPQIAIVWVDLTKLPPETKPATIYPGLRQLAQTIDEDCKQMGLVVPMVLALQIPPTANAAQWAQLDTDTDLNAGEFAVRLPTAESENPAIVHPIAADDTTMESFLAELQCQHFEPASLSHAIRPRSEEDYRQALIQTESGHRSPMHDELLTRLVQPNWHAPEQLTAQLTEFIESFSAPTSPEQPTAD